VKHFIVLFLILLGGCAISSRVPPPGGFQVVDGVPFRAQEGRYDCGAAALSSLLGHRGADIPVSEIDRSVRDPRFAGTLMADLENHARSLGYLTRSGRGDLELLRRRIDEGCPLAIVVQRGRGIFSSPHYLVIYGYDEDSFLVHDGLKEGVVIKTSRLAESWEKMNRLYLSLESR